MVKVRILQAAGLLVAVFATIVVVRTWLGEHSFTEGESAQRRGDLNAADTAYRTGSSRGNADAALARVRLEFLRHDWAAADTSLREALALAPTRGFPYVLQARIEINRPGPWDGAREDRILTACRRAVVLEPGWVATWSESAGSLLELVSLRREYWDPARIRIVVAEAADGFAKALELGPGAAGTLFARMLDEGGDPVFLLDVASRRGDPASLSALVDLLLNRSLWAGAESDLWAVAESHAILPAYAGAVSEVLARRGRLQESLSAARRGLLAAPKDGALMARAADIAARLPGPEALAALPLYRDAVAAAPANMAVRRRFANFLAARSVFAEAEVELRAVVRADPGNAPTWFLLGETLRRSGRNEEAAVAYREAARLRPENAAYLKQVAEGSGR